MILESSTARFETVEAAILGRYIVRPTPAAQAPLLVGFHGYGENAERHLQELIQIDGIANWLVVSVQALHRFYDRRSGEVVGSWMTSQDRERMIGDNLSYVAAILNTIHQRYQTTSTIVYSGFSQGVAMAYRRRSYFRHRQRASSHSRGTSRPNCRVIPPSAGPES